VYIDTVEVIGVTEIFTDGPGIVEAVSGDAGLSVNGELMLFMDIIGCVLDD
jgi:hypothetical protein